MTAEEIANKARKSISTYCYKECKAYCCRKGYLVLTKKQLNLITKNNPGKDQIKPLVFNTFSLNLSQSCPSLKDFKCVIHKNKDRPDTCKQFPVFIEKDTVRLSSRCPAIKEGLFYPYIYEWIALGYNIIEGKI